MSSKTKKRNKKHKKGKYTPSERVLLALGILEVIDALLNLITELLE